MVAKKITSVFIVGPTASGKSELAMNLALKHDGEIICADSQTVRRGLDIGTAKPTKKDQKQVKHHLVDVIDPYENFSVAKFKELASKAFDEVRDSNKLPIVVGGTGLYIDALLYDFSFRQSSSDYTRQELESYTVEKLQQILLQKGTPLPDNKKNPRHLIRSIESEGQLPGKGVRIEESIIVGIDPGKEVLEKRIENRIQGMIEAGFLEEVDGIIEKHGLMPERFDAIGYRIAIDCRDDEGNYDEVKIARRFEIADRKYAKRQRSWFKRNKDIVWFEDSSQAFKYLNKLF